nr:hypothetical protein [Thiobacillus denitrificans]
MPTAFLVEQAAAAGAAVEWRRSLDHLAAVAFTGVQADDPAFADGRRAAWIAYRPHVQAHPGLAEADHRHRIGLVSGNVERAQVAVDIALIGPRLAACAGLLDFAVDQWIDPDTEDGVLHEMERPGYVGTSLSLSDTRPRL